MVGLTSAGRLPPTTAVQIQRRIGALFHKPKYRKQIQRSFRSAASRWSCSAPSCRRGCRFYQHHGIDLAGSRQAGREGPGHGRLGRGGSTITPQLVKNLFLTTHGSVIRKGAEFTAGAAGGTYLAQEPDSRAVPERDRMGPGIYGAESAARLYYKEPASAWTRAGGAAGASSPSADQKAGPHGSLQRRDREPHAQMGW